MATSPLHVQRRDDGIYVFKIDVTEEKMNVLNESVMSAFDTALAELEKLPPAEKAKAVVVLSGKPESFIAGEQASAGHCSCWATSPFEHTQRLDTAK